MKFIANSLYLSTRIEEAINKKCDSFYTNRHSLRFCNTESVVDVSFSGTNSSIRESPETGIFLTESWLKVVDYLKRIPEQPIVVTLGYSQIEISQHVAVFTIGE